MRWVLYLFKGSCRQALDFAIHMVAEPDVAPPAPLDPQLILNLQGAIARTQKSCSPSFFGTPFCGDAKKV